MTSQNPLCVAFDRMSYPVMENLATRLSGSGSILKFNSTARREGLERIVSLCRATDADYFLDWKLHDVPPTVADDARNVNALGEYAPCMLTAHASGGTEMMRAIVEELAGCRTQVLGITLLTSLDSECGHIYTTDTLDTVLRLAEVAMKGGAHGLVCSAREVAELRRRFPEALLVIPGVRSEGAEHGAQKRVRTPRQALDDGADYVVIGSEATKATDPLAVIERIKRDIGM